MHTGTSDKSHRAWSLLKEAKVTIDQVVFLAPLRQDRPGPREGVRR
jgi:hypothetical protein